MTEGLYMMISSLRKFLGVLSYVVMLTQSTCHSDSYRVKLSGPMTIGNEWVELHPESPLKAENDLQMVLLDLEAPFKDDLYKEGKGANKGAGILTPDGEVINPEIEVVDQYGNKFNLVYAGAREDAPAYDLPYPNKWPRDREYKTIRIRSPRPVKCKAIYWFCESTKDWP